MRPKALWGLLRRDPTGKWRRLPRLLELSDVMLLVLGLAAPVDAIGVTALAQTRHRSCFSPTVNWMQQGEVVPDHDNRVDEYGVGAEPAPRFAGFGCGSRSACILVG